MLSVEYFAQQFHGVLARGALPLFYYRQSYDAVGDSGLHLHADHYALYVVHGGRGVHEINSHPYGIARGDVYLAPPGSIHAYRDCENLEVDVFCFQAELFNEAEIAALRALPGFRGLFIDAGEAGSTPGPGNLGWSSHRLHLAPAARGEVETFVREVTRELNAPPEALAERILARVLFFRLLVALARVWHESAPREKMVEYRQVEIAEVIRFCEAHFSEPFSVPQLAAKMFLSSSRFSEIWKKEMGVSPGEYLRDLRLRHAQTLLKTTTRRAGEIAHECGFSDAAQFSRAFKNAFGVAPREYRRRFAAN